MRIDQCVGEEFRNERDQGLSIQVNVANGFESGTVEVISNVR